MAKYYGKIGFGVTKESPVGSGKWPKVITEHSYYGDVIRNSRRLDTNEQVNPNITVGNSISIVADAYANDHYYAMLYIEWAGSLWIISNVEVQAPRLILRLGGVYNGPKAPAPADPGDDTGDA